MLSFSEIPNFVKGATTAAADKASAALYGLLIPQPQDWTISEAEFSKHCGPAPRYSLISLDQAACRAGVQNKLFLDRLPKGSLVQHWDRMLLSVITLLDFTRDWMADIGPVQPLTIQLIPLHPITKDPNTVIHI